MRIEKELKDVISEILPETSYGNAPIGPGWPRINFFRVSNPQHPTVDIQNPRFQISVRASSLGQAREIADNVRDRLHRLQGRMGNAYVNSILVLNDNELYEQEAKVFHIPMTIKLQYKEV